MTPRANKKAGESSRAELATGDNLSDHVDHHPNFTHEETKALET